MTVFETPGHVALRVTLAGGEVKVETGDAPTVDVELEPLRDNEVTRKAIAEARVEMTEQDGRYDVVVELAKRSGFVVGRVPAVRVRVRCPRGSDLVLRAVSADLGASGPLGAVEIHTASGDVSLGDVGSLELQTASGDVRVGDVAGQLAVRTASGDVSARRCVGPLSAKLVSGDLSVAEASAGMAVSTVSGDVRVGAAGGGEMRVQSVSGDVRLGIKAGEHLYLDASSVSGSVKSELGVEDAPSAESSAPVVELRVRTVSGDLEIVRAAAAA